MAKNLADRLEVLSGYKHLFSPDDPLANLNPTNVSYLRFKLGGRVYYLLSRIADAGLDYTERTNKLAHHIVLDRGEMPAAGPAWLASQAGFFETTWTGQPRHLPDNRPLPSGTLQAGVCNTWKAVTGDAGWAGLLAESLASRTAAEAYLLCKPGTQVLTLFLEAQSLLPEAKRWEATFSTYFTKVPPGVECRWRCVIDGTAEATRLRKSPKKLVIDLAKPLLAAEGGELVEAARTGVLPTPTKPESKLTEKDVVQRATPPLPVSRSSVQPSLDKRPPALPSQKRATAWGTRRSKKSSLWKVIAIAGALVFAMIAGAVGYSVWFVGRMPVAPVIAQLPSESEVLRDRAGKGNTAKVGNTTERKKDIGESHRTVKPSAPQAVVSPSESETETIDQKSKNIRADVLMHIFDGVSDMTILPKIPQTLFGPGIDSWQDPVMLGNLSSIDVPIGIKLFGVGEKGKSLVHVQSSKDNRSEWEITKESETNTALIVVAKIKLKQNGKHKRQITFQWTNAAFSKRDIVNNIVRPSILELFANTAGLASQNKYVSFLPFKSDGPWKLNESFAKSGWGQLTPDVNIPNGQNAILYYSVKSSKPLGLKNDANGILSKDTLESIPFGPGNSAVLQLVYKLEDSRQPKVVATLRHRSDDESKPPRLNDWIRDNTPTRIKHLKNAIIGYIKLAYNRKDLKLIRNWGEDYSLPYKPTAKGTSLVISEKSLMKWLPKKISRLLVLERNFRNDIQSLYPKATEPIIYENLKKHLEEYPYLIELREFLDNWKSDITIHLRVSRQVNVSDAHDQSHLHEVDLYIAGNPD